LRRIVVRSETFSIVPVTSPTSTMSPTPYWSSAIMKNPARKSRTIVWAPKPIAMPAIPAPARSGARLMPTSPRINSAAMIHTTMVAVLAKTLVIVSVRAVARASISWSSRSRPALPRRAISSARERFSSVSRSRRWLMARFNSLLTTKAINTSPVEDPVADDRCRLVVGQVEDPLAEPTRVVAARVDEVGFVGVGLGVGLGCCDQPDR
jgi:hypothetical protein